MAVEKEKAIPLDEQFLRDFVAKGGKAETPGGDPVDAANVDKYLDEVGKDAKGSVKKVEQLHKEAVKKEVADTTKEDEKAREKERERIERLKEKERKKKQGQVAATTKQIIQTGRENYINPILERGGQVADKISSASTVGGIGLLLMILIFLLCVVVVVNSKGDTRLKQLWYMLNGRATLQGRIDKSGAGATFGSTPTPTPTTTPTPTPKNPVPKLPIPTPTPIALSLLSDYRSYSV